VWEKKDQLQAHLFLVGRFVRAMVAADPDLRRSPSRRATSGWVAGAVIAALIAGVFLVIGFFTGGDSGSWKVAGTVVVEEETGARFLYLGDRLHPLLNRTSLQLARSALGPAAGLGPPAVVPAVELAGVPRTAPMGIPGAPESLPAPGRLSTAPWSLCSTGAEGAPELAVAAPPPGRALRPGEALLVRSASGLSLLWDGFRYAVDASTLTALGAGGVDPVPVPESFVAPLPAGTPLTPWRVAGAGDPGTVVDGQQLRVGQVVRTTGTANGGEFFVAGRAGLIRITETAGMLLLAGPDATAAYPGGAARLQYVSPAGAATGLATDGAPARTWPAAAPVLVRLQGAGERPCAQLTFDQDGATRAAFGLGDPGVIGRGPVTVAPDQGVLVRTAGAAPDSPVMVIADDGRGYPLDEEARRALGYDDRQVRLVPENLVRLVPAGTPLSLRAAVSSLS
jgi:type VII secretion protein EccB